MRQLEGLELIADEGLAKVADSVLGEAKTIPGAIARGTAYAAPVVGTGLSFSDAVNDFRNGRIGSGFENLGWTALGAIGDILAIGGTAAAPATFGTSAAGGIGIRSLIGSAKAARMARLAKGIAMHAPGAIVGTLGEMEPIIRHRLEESEAQASPIVPKSKIPESVKPETAPGRPAPAPSASPPPQSKKVLPPPRKPRYGYNFETDRYERLYE